MWRPARPFWTVAVAACLAAPACGKGIAKVEGVALAQADQVIEAPIDGSLVVVHERWDNVDLPPSGGIRFAFHWGVPWKAVWGLVGPLRAANRSVTLLVGRRATVNGFTLSDTLQSMRPIKVYATYSDGKACVQAPNVKEAKCVQSPDKKYLDRAGLRSTIREAVDKLDTYDVSIEVAPDLSWGDVVRALDSARTCCKGDTVRAALSEDSFAL